MTPTRPAALAALGIPAVGVPGTHSFTPASITGIVAASSAFLAPIT